MAGIARGIVAAALLAAQAAGVPAQAAAAPAALPAAPRDLATQCYWANASRIVGSSNQTAVVGDAVWYIMEYLRTDGPPGNMIEQIQAMSGESPAIDKAFLARAPAMVDACRARFPLSRPDAPVTLPADEFDRDVLCLGVTSLLYGFADGEQKDTGKSAVYAPADALMNRLYVRLDDATLAAHGHRGDEAVNALISGSLRTATTYGSLMGVFAACRTAIPE